MPLLELELEGSLAVKERMPGAITIFVDAPLDELERRLRGARPRAGARSRSGSRSPPSRRSSPGSFDYVVENDDRERAADECVAIVERELNSAATMARR